MTRTIIDLRQNPFCGHSYQWHDYRTEAEKAQQRAESMWTRPMREPRTIDLPVLLAGYVPPADPNRFTGQLSFSFFGGSHAR